MSDDDECKRIIVTSGLIDRNEAAASPYDENNKTHHDNDNGVNDKSSLSSSSSSSSPSSGKHTMTTATTVASSVVTKDLNNNIDDHNYHQNNHNHNLNNRKSLKWAATPTAITSVDQALAHQDIISKFAKKDLNNKSRGGHEYESCYSEAFALDLNAREGVFFRPNEPIYVQITSHDEEPSLVVLHTNVYTIQVRHGRHAWTIKRKYKQFLKLYEAYALFKTKLNIKNVALSSYLTTPQQQHVSTSSSGSTITTPISTAITHTTSDEDNCVESSKFKPSDHFKLIFQTIASDFNQAKNILEKFLQEVVDHRVFRNHNETLRFLEVSHLSFISDLGEKNKEGIVKKQKRSFHIGCCHSAIKFLWDSRWLVVKDTWIGYLNPQTGLLKCVLLVDQGFRVQTGADSTGTRNGLSIENLSKSLIVKCHNEKRAHEWRMSILQMLFTTGQKFLADQRFGSFAPIREDTNNDSHCKWFVDGSDYMDSIADSIESAKQEIFITGFFLSPEIYLKRPMVCGDKWRLDKLLKRKAEEGVKIYVLIYKEIELTLAINSAYSKRVLALSHKNIKVLRHPDRINEPNKFLNIMWAHHEKLVIIDQSLAYFGGIDLAFGRWDNHMHKLTDLGSVLPPRNPSFRPTTRFNNQKTTSEEAFDMLPCEDRTSSSKSDQQSGVRLVNFKIRKDSLLESTTTTTKNNNQSNNSETTALIKSSSTTMTNETTRTADISHDDTVTLTTTSASVVRSSSNNNNRRLKAIRMMSSPSCSFDMHENHPSAVIVTQAAVTAHVIGGSFGNLSVGISGTKTATTKTKQNPDEDAVAADSKPPSRFDRFDRFFRAGLVKSKSLEAIDRTRDELLNELQFPVSQLNQQPSSYNRLRSIKESINCRLNRSKSQTSPSNARREYGELTIFNKLKKIRQFKESLKRSKAGGEDNEENDEEEDENERGNHDQEEIYRELNRNMRKQHHQQQQKQDVSSSSSTCDGQDGVGASAGVRGGLKSDSCATMLELQGSSKYWMGKDYCNFIYKDVKEVHSPFKESIDRTNVPRMPWHDVAGCVCGPAARDIARHFIQRWNYVKMKKVHHKKIYPLLVPKSYQAPYLYPPGLIAKCTSGCRMQVLRSVGEWSSGQSRTESSIHAAMRHMITHAQHYVYIENQFFVSLMDTDSTNSSSSSSAASGGSGGVQNGIAQCLFDRIVLASKNKTPFKCYILVPLIPGYEGEYGRSSGVVLHAITHYNNASINGLIKRLADVGVEALNYICFFSLRTWSELNSRLVTELIYVHSKLMIVDDRMCLIGSANINDRSLLGNRDSEVAVLIEDTHMCPGVLNKQPVQVGQFASTLRQRLFGELLGELQCTSNSSTTTTTTTTTASTVGVVVGAVSQHMSSSSSSSLNSTSALSSSVSPTHSWSAAAGSSTITRPNRLDSIRLSESHPQQAAPLIDGINSNTTLHSSHNHVNNNSSHHHHLDLTDPCSDDFYKKVLLKYASQNTKIYDQVFNVIPSNYVNNFQQLKEYQKTVSLSQRDPGEARNELAKVKGYIVLYPNRFLCYEDLKPPLGTKEKLIPNVIWT